MQGFYDFVAETIEVEVEEVSAGTLLSDLDLWDSMTVISIIAFASSELDKEVSGDSIGECETLGDVEALLYGG